MKYYKKKMNTSHLTMYLFEKYIINKYLSLLLHLKCLLRSIFEFFKYFIQCYPSVNDKINYL